MASSGQCHLKETLPNRIMTRKALIRSKSTPIFSRRFSDVFGTGLVHIQLMCKISVPVLLKLALTTLSSTNPLSKRSKMITTTYCLLLAAIASCIASGDDHVVKITPSPNSGLRGYADNGYATSNNENVKEGFIELPDLYRNTVSIEVLFFADEEPHVFKREKGWDTPDGFYWYGEDDYSSLNLLVKYETEEQGKRFAG